MEDLLPRMRMVLEFLTLKLGRPLTA